MRDAARDVGPGGAPLGGHQLGDVVERDDEPFDPALGALLRDLNVERPHLAAARQLDLRVGGPASPLPRFGEHGGERRDRLVERLADEIAFRLAERIERRAVDEVHLAARRRAR